MHLSLVWRLEKNNGFHHKSFMSQHNVSLKAEKRADVGPSFLGRLILFVILFVSLTKTDLWKYSHMQPSG